MNLRIIQQGLGKCTLDIYANYLMVEPVRTTCTGLSGCFMEISHDSVNRFLLSKNYSPIDLFQLVRDRVDLNKGILSVDDSVIDKPYSDHTKTALICYQWSGKHHRSVKGIGIVLYRHQRRICSN